MIFSPLKMRKSLRTIGGSMSIVGQNTPELPLTISRAGTGPHHREGDFELLQKGAPTLWG